MKRKRIGNDINIAWAIVTEDGKPFDLNIGKVSLYLKNYVRKEEVKGFSIEGNVILWTFLGKNQKNLGNHSLELVINEDAEGMITTDACDFVCLVPCSCKEGGEDDNGVTTETVNLTSVITLGGGSYDDTEIKEAIAELDETKQDIITDLETIRSGASKGATALQSIPAEYVTETELNIKVAGKQDVLVSGTNVKTINGQSIVGSGNITIKGDADTSTLATKEELTNLTNEIIDNEEVVASAFNDVNARINALAENVSGEAATKVELAESVETINATINANDKRYESEFTSLDNRIDELAANVSGETVTKVEFEQRIESLTNEILDNEEVVASAVNDLNARIAALEDIIATLQNS